jgi:hypothetical protein
MQRDSRVVCGSSTGRWIGRVEVRVARVWFLSGEHFTWGVRVGAKRKGWDVAVVQYDSASLSGAEPDGNG